MKLTRSQRSTALVLAISLREWKSRVIFLLFGCLALVFLLLSHAENPAMASARMALTDLLAPTVNFLSQPVQTTQTLAGQWQKWQDVYTQNETLRAENAQLKQWQSMTAELQAENESLRNLLKLAPAETHHYLSGKMIGNLAGSFSQSQFLDIGAAEGVVKDMAVISGEGLAGRVLEVGNSTSRVMLVTDINSRIAVMGQNSREKAVAIGRDHSLLELHYLADNTQMKPGELILSSGDAKLLPAGIPVGRVVKVEKNQVLVKPIVDWTRLSYVSLIAE